MTRNLFYLHTHRHALLITLPSFGVVNNNPIHMTPFLSSVPTLCVHYGVIHYGTSGSRGSSSGGAAAAATAHTLVLCARLSIGPGSRVGPSQVSAPFGTCQSKGVQIR